MGALSDLWLKWKMLKLPWRRKFLIGQDLSGNTYWEFKDTRSSQSTKLRRIVKYPRKTYMSDVQLSPQWHQWLRHTRTNPPTIAEQTADVNRQVELKGLAQLADQRWAEKKRYIAAPTQREKKGSGDEVDSSNTKPKEDPWKNAAADTQGGKWQPDAWVPGQVK